MFLGRNEKWGLCILTEQTFKLKLKCEFILIATRMTELAWYEIVISRPNMSSKTIFYFCLGGTKAARTQNRNQCVREHK